MLAGMALQPPFCTQLVLYRFADILFSGLSEKSMQKRDAVVRNSAVTPEKQIVTLCVLSLHYRRPNALRAAVQSGFPSARYTVRVVLFVPVEYLTYESRKAVTQQALPYRIHPKQPQSISMTSPVWQSRICIALCKSEIISAQTELRGKSKEGGPQPPSWSF
jgi:hypothetical protein